MLTSGKNKSNISPTPKNVGISILAQGCEFKGKMVLNGETRIGGNVFGTIVSTGFLILENSSLCQLELHGHDIVVCGQFSGTIIASGILKVMPGAVVSANIFANRLIVEDGAKIKGSVSYEVGQSKNEQNPSQLKLAG